MRPTISTCKWQCINFCRPILEILAKSERSASEGTSTKDDDALVIGWPQSGNHRESRTGISDLQYQTCAKEFDEGL